MKMPKTRKLVAITTLLSAGAVLGATANATTVLVNGQSLATAVPPIEMNGRTLVPMRDIFQRLGANVQWDGANRDITATRGNTNVWLQIGNNIAMVNGQRKSLGQAPIMYRGATMVPLRFVSEALGANVAWDNRTRIVSINTNGTTTGGSGEQVAGVRNISVPAGAVVPVTLDQDLSSASARRGDVFTATVKSATTGDSEFPAGTKLQGVVNEVVRKDTNRAGALDLSFNAVILPDGARRTLRGSLTALDDDSVNHVSSGRIMAKPKSGKGDNTKSILIGAGAGFLIGKVLLKKNALLSGALGALGGYLYGKRNDKDTRVAEVEVDRGTELGVRLDTTVTYADNYGYGTHRQPYLSLS